MSATYHHDDLFSFDPNLKGPFVGSLLFHLAVLLVASFGLPYIVNDKEIISNPISVEIVEISDITQTNRVAPPKPVKEEPEQPSPPVEKLNPPQNLAEKPPDLITPTPPEIEEVPPLEEPQPPKPEPKAEKPKPKPAPKKPPPKKEVTKKVEQEDQFQSLLKSMADDVNPSKEDAEAKELNPSTQKTQIAQMGDRLTMSEEDAIAAQIYPCWNVPTGAKFAEDLVVDIRVFMARDGTVTNSQVLDQLRYSGDSYYRAAADAAQRALRNPNCMPLKYPPEKYEQMKAFVFRFDPSQML